MSKLLTGTDEIMMKLSQAQESEPGSKLAPSNTVLLTDLSKQLQLKAQLFQELDDKIVAATDDDDQLEEAVFELANLQASLSAKLVLISHTLVTSSPLASPAVPSDGHGDQSSATQQLSYQQWQSGDPTEL